MATVDGRQSEWVVGLREARHYDWSIVDSDDSPHPDPEQHSALTTRAEAFAELADLNDEPGAQAQGLDGSGAGGQDDLADGEAAPPVVAVVVVHNAGDWLDDLLVSLGRQTYDNLSVLVIDAASDIDPTPQVAKVLPGAFVRRLEANVGYGPTVNEILELVSGASFFFICHDDVVVDDDCIHELVAEAFRSNAGIVGPKVVDWDAPHKLLSVGFTIDRSGGRAPYAERHELDQGQHDAVRDVFAVTGAATLIRTDLFDHLGGFDPAIDLLGEDLDLCWRAHLVGARVVVAPRGRVRHREALAERVDAARLVRVDAAHRLRTVWSNYRLFHLLVLIPLLVVTSIVEAIVEVSMGRRSHARAQLGAWATNLRALPSIMTSRRKVRALRESNDRTIARLQTKTWARMEGLIQAHRRARAEERDQAVADYGQFRDAESPDREDSYGDDPDSDGFVRTGAPRRAYSLIAWGIIGVIVVLAVGTRELFFGPLPAVGTFAAPPSSLSGIWHTWFSSWNPQGLGGAGVPAAGLSPLAIGGSILGGSFGLLRRLAILAPIPIGLFGVWRLAKPLGSRRSQLVALVVFAAVPVGWNALSQGSWAGLVVYAAAPWVVACAMRSMRVAPFTATAADDEHDDPSWWSPILGYGLLLALVGAIVPAIAAVAVVAAIGLVLGSLLVGRPGGLGRLAGTTFGAVVVAIVLLLPWTFAGPARSGWSLAGAGGTMHGWLGLGEILSFHSGPMGAGLLAYGFLIVAALPLAIGRSWRFAWGVRAWTVAGACFTVVWLGQQEWFSMPTPAPDVFLAAAAVALAFAAACGAAAFEADLSSFRFGWAQAASAVATIALVLSILPWIGNAADGRWRMAPVGLDQVLQPVTAQRAQQPFRMLWVGDPSILPMAGWNLDDHTSYGISNGGSATMDELWAPADAGASAVLAKGLALAKANETTRLGRILADAGVRYIVLPRQSVPLPYRSSSHPMSARLVDALDDQLDLARVSLGNDAVIVYRNEAWRPGQRLYPLDTKAGSTAADALDAPVARTVLGTVDPSRTNHLRIAAPGILATGQPADASWRLAVNGKAAEPVTLWGWEQGFVVTNSGNATLHRTGGALRFVWLVVVFLLWIAAFLGWWLGRRRRSDDELVHDDMVAATGSGSLVRVGEGATPAGSVTVSEVRVGEDDESAVSGAAASEGDEQ